MNFNLKKLNLNISFFYCKKMIDYPEAVVIDINDEPIEGQVVGVERNYDEELAQRKLICCLSILVTSLMVALFGYILADI